MISGYRNKIVGNLRRKYIIALGFLTLFSTVSYIFFLYSVKTIDTGGYLINLSGKERFIAERVALSALQYVSYKDSAEKVALQKIFLDRINEMADAHNFLAHDSVSALVKKRSPEIESLYFSPPVRLDEKVNRYINEAHLLAGAIAVELTMENTHLQYLLNSSNDLLASLNLVVYQYQKENENKIKKFYYGRTAVFIGMLLSYLLVGIIIFRPMTKEIDRNLTMLEINESTLRQAKEEHISAIIDAQEKEKQRIATDLHDGLIQTLTAIAYKMEHSQEVPPFQNNLTETKRLINNAIIETRNIAHSILPPILKQFGLIPALKALTDQIKFQTGISLLFQTFDFAEKVNSNLELALYRIVQETLNNVVKHSEAKNVKIQLIRHPESIVLIIEDDGKGFDPAVKRGGGGMGLININERVTMFKGNIAINSAYNSGTEIMIEIPIINSQPSKSQIYNFTHWGLG